MFLEWWKRIRKVADDDARQRWAVEGAVSHFMMTRGVKPMGAHVLSEGPDEWIVRVMFLSDHIPPDRAWYAMPVSGGPPRELSYRDVETLETRTWR